MGFSTDAIHVGQEPDALTGAIVAPIYQTSTYVIEEMGKSKGYDYARTSHPNRSALERTLAKLEGGSAAYVFTSGMAGIDAVFRLLRPGDHTILSQAVYGGVFRITTKLLVDFGLRVQLRRYLRPGESARSDQAEHENDLRGDADESHDEHLGHRGHRRPCAREKHHDGGGQHFSEPVLPEAARAGSAHRRPLDDEISERPQRLHRRRRGAYAHRRRRENSTSFRSRQAPGSRPWIASSYRAASRRWRCAWSATMPTAWPWPNISRHTQK